MNNKKFRAWDRKTSTMICTGYAVLGETTLFGMIEQYLRENSFGKPMLERLIDVVEMQYTGMDDKKKNEIYEFDILQLSIKLNNERNPTFIVAFVAGAFRVVHTKSYQFIDSGSSVEEVLNWLIENNTSEEDLDDSFGTWTLLSSFVGASDWGSIKVIGNIFQDNKTTLP